MIRPVPSGDGDERSVPAINPPAPRRHPESQAVRLADILGALSYALDLTEGQPAGHGVRCCWIGIHIGQELGLADSALDDLYYTLLLKDIGCSSNAARVCELYLTDDITFKHDYKTVGTSLPQALRFVLGHTGLKSGLTERFQTLLHVIQNGGEIAREMIETRCQRGADIARQMHFSEMVATGIRDLDEHWDGTGQPQGLQGTQISLLAQIALMAQVVDVFDVSAGEAAARREVRHRSGAWFDPRLVAAFERAAASARFWTMLGRSDLQQAVFALEPAQRMEALDDDYLDDIAEAFAQVVDAKSPFTSGHSARVASFADIIAAELGISAERRRWLRRAGLLHDIGKLGVSNQILDKSGKLDAAEWGSVREHPAAGERILSRIAGFQDLARIAGEHHERLDGGGYPRGLKGSEIGLETRIMTVADVFDAMTADRPYRAAMPIAEAAAIMRADLGKAFDPTCFAALLQGLAKREGVSAD